MDSASTRKKIIQQGTTMTRPVLKVGGKKKKIKKKLSSALKRTTKAGKLGAVATSASGPPKIGQRPIGRALPPPITATAAPPATESAARLVPLLSPAADSGAAATAALRWMIAPTATARFFETFWELKPLLVERNAPEYYSAVFSSAELDRILRQDNIQFGRNLDVTSYCDGVRETHNPAGRAHAAVVWDYYRNGCSVRLLNPQTYSSAVWRLCATLQEYFGCMVGANVYLTPPGTQGFAPHYDDIEAFVLQLEGKKHWRIYAPRPGEELARESSGNLKPEDLSSPPVLEATLSAGDLLYFPRGTIHQGRSLVGQHSLHITVSCYQHMAWADLLQKMVPVALQRAAAEDVRFRRGLPVGLLRHAGLANDDTPSPHRDALVRTARLLVTRLADFLPVDAAVDQMGRQYVRDALPPSLTRDERCRSVHEDSERWVDGRVRGTAAMDTETRVKLVRGNVVRLVNESGELRLYHCVENSRVYHEVQEQPLELQDELQAAAVAHLLHTYPAYTPLADLPGHDDQTKVTFVGSLWEKGLIVTAEPTCEQSDDAASSKEE